MRARKVASIVGIVVASIVGAALLLAGGFVALFFFIFRDVPPAASWDEGERAQVRQFAEQIAVVGHVTDVRFFDTEGGLGVRGAYATIILEPDPGVDRFTQADYDTIIAALAARGWRVVENGCYAGDGLNTTTCALNGPVHLRLHSNAITVDIGHGWPIPLESRTS